VDFSQTNMSCIFLRYCNIDADSQTTISCDSCCQNVLSTLTAGGNNPVRTSLVGNDKKMNQGHAYSHQHFSYKEALFFVSVTNGM